MVCEQAIIGVAVKRFLFAILFVLFLPMLISAQSITLRDTLFLNKATHINYDVAAWDTVFVDIMRGSAQVQRVFLTSNGKGRWRGVFKPTYSGEFVAEYNAVYSGDTTVEEQYFAVLETTAFMGLGKGDSSLYMRTDWNNIKNPTTYQNFSQTRIHFVDSLGEEITATCEGAGANTVIFTIKDASDSTGLPNFVIQAEDSAGGAFGGQCITRPAGACTLGLGNSTYTIYLGATGWDITSPVYVNVSGDTSLTYYATYHGISTPPAPTMCMLQFNVSAIDSTRLAGCRFTVWVPGEYNPIMMADDTTDIISPYSVTRISDVDGNVECPVYRSVKMYSRFGTVKVNMEVLSPTGQVIAKKVRVIVPDQASWEITW